jgi:phage gpG-like protein
MTFSATISPESIASFSTAVKSRLEAARQPVQAAMAETLFNVVDANFGSVGWDRPFEWAPLSPSYAKKVGREFATLFVTGALKATLEKESGPEVASVSMGNSSQVPYALAHHYGVAQNNLPARRVFPLDESGKVTDKTVAVVIQSAKAALKGVLS